MKRLLLSIAVVLAVGTITTHAQKGSGSISELEGTAWRVTTMDWYPIRGIPIVYGFGEKGRADVVAFVEYTQK